MEQSVKHLLDFSKASIDTGFEAMTMIQKQMETFNKALMGQNRQVTEETQKTINEWVQVCKKGQDDFKKVVTSNVKKVEEYFQSLSPA